jgi:hypothetical protein
MGGGLDILGGCVRTWAGMGVVWGLYSRGAGPVGVREQASDRETRLKMPGEENLGKKKKKERRKSKRNAPCQQVPGRKGTASQPLSRVQVGNVTVLYMCTVHTHIRTSIYNHNSYP